MTLKYNGIAIAGTGVNVPISATPLFVWDAVITATAAATIVGANGAIMGTLVAGVPFPLPGGGFNTWGDAPQLDLSQYQVNTAGGQTVYVAYSIRQA